MSARGGDNVALVSDPDKPDTTPRAARKRPLMTITLSPAARLRLEEMSKRSGVAASRIIEELVEAAPMPPRKLAARYKPVRPLKRRPKAGA